MWEFLGRICNGASATESFWQHRFSASWVPRESSASTTVQRDAQTIAEAGPAERLAELLAEGRDLTFAIDSTQLIQDLEDGSRRVEQTGLAHALAEYGLLPMYGMPTRVRSLYVGLKRDRKQRTWSKVDRDLIQSFYEGTRAKDLAQQLDRSVDGVFHSLSRIRQSLLACIRCALTEDEQG